MIFLEALKLCIEKNLVFAAYRLPHGDSVRLIVQKDPVAKIVSVNSNLFNATGFLISPFFENDLNHSYLIQPDLDYISTDYIDFEELRALQALPRSVENFENGITSRREFINQVEGIKNAIKEKKFEKVVISRIKVIEKKYRSRLTEIFQLLINSYSNAFVYLFNVDGQVWIGATPEPLICSDKNVLETVSLAGTREFNDDNLNLQNWSKKEKDEQELVTLFIENILTSFNLKYLHKKGPYTKRAGNLIHLRTDFALDFQNINGQLGKLVQELHPTSAVCGYPKKESLEFILNVEKHNRRFYSGFLGPINIDERILLFVNLRCMQVMDERLVLHVGAGITRDSLPEDEWDETEIKADTLLSIIHKV